MAEFHIRGATRSDSRAFLKLVKGLADFERLEPPDHAGRRRIINDVFVKKRARLFLAFNGKTPAGYALYFYTYSSFLARPTFYLEDIFVKEAFRNSGIGRSLFMTCIKEAVKNHCGRFEFAVLTWNQNAIDFYEKLGAERLKEWYYYRMTEETIKKLRNLNQSRKRKIRPS